MIRFQADADLNQVILLTTIRREPTIDFQTAQAIGLTGLHDKEVLAIAAKEGRMLVSHDRKTMPKYFYEFIATQTSPGLIIIPQYLLTTCDAEDLILIWSASEPEEWINQICFLPL